MEKEFLARIVEFLKDVEWLYDFPVTQVFSRDILTKFPEEWLKVFKNISLPSLNGIPECKGKEDWPSSLNDFLTNCKELSLKQWVHTSHQAFIADNTHSLQIPKEFYRGMSPKKRHEVLSIINYMKKLGHITHSNHVLDIGSGMGYVDSALHHLLKVTVIGAESKDGLIESAQARQEKFTGGCSAVEHMKWFLQDNQATLDKAKEIVCKLISRNALCTCNVDHKKNLTAKCTNLVDTNSKSFIGSEEKDIVNIDREVDSKDTSSVILMGLHSCADLSPIMIKIFKHCPKISALMLFSCCYHKLENFEKNNIKLSDTKVTSASHERDLDNKIYANFPMSEALKCIMEKNDFHFSVYGLRLAAQESGVRWLKHTKKDHECHEKNVAYRAILEIFCQREHLALKKCRRRCARKSKFCSFDEYVATVIENYEFIPSEEDDVLSCQEISGSSEKSDLRLVTKEVSGDSIESKGYCSIISKDCTDLLNQKNTGPPSHIKTSLMGCYADYKDFFYLLEPLTGLQLALQPVLEALVLLDRLAFLKENNFDNVFLEEVFDAAISPRSVALFAIR